MLGRAGSYSGSLLLAAEWDSINWAPPLFTAGGSRLTSVSTSEKWSKWGITSVSEGIIPHIWKPLMPLLIFAYFTQAELSKLQNTRLFIFLEGLFFRKVLLAA